MMMMMMMMTFLFQQIMHSAHQRLFIFRLIGYISVLYIIIVIYHGKSYI